MTQFNQPYYGDVLQDMNRVVVDHVVNHPRSLQKTIGPSEMGCDRCIARHFAGVEKMPETQIDMSMPLDELVEKMPWLPQIGTSWHSTLEGWFEEENDRLLAETGYERWLVENRVPVGAIGGRFIDGSCDLFDLWTGSVIDHKLVGTTKLKKVRSKRSPGLTYRKQAHVYGRGWALKGYDVRKVGVRFYPRNDISMAAGILWIEDFDPAFAEAAVENVIALSKTAQALAGTPALDPWIFSLVPDADCFSCDEYPPLEGDTPAHDQADLVRSDLFSQPTPVQRRY